MVGLARLLNPVCKAVLLDDLRMIDRDEIRLAIKILHRVTAICHYVAYQGVRPGE